MSRSESEFEFRVLSRTLRSLFRRNTYVHLLLIYIVVFALARIYYFEDKSQVHEIRISHEVESMPISTPFPEPEPEPHKDLKATKISETTEETSSEDYNPVTETKDVNNFMHLLKAAEERGLAKHWIQTTTTTTPTASTTTTMIPLPAKPGDCSTRPISSMTGYVPLDLCQQHHPFYRTPVGFRQIVDPITKRIEPGHFPPYEIAKNGTVELETCTLLKYPCPQFDQVASTWNLIDDDTYKDLIKQNNWKLYTSLKHTMHDNKVRRGFILENNTCKLGGEFTMLVTIRDDYGNPKKYGGDFLLARTVPIDYPDYKIYGKVKETIYSLPDWEGTDKTRLSFDPTVIPGHVVDNRNGTYSIQIPCKFAGEYRIQIFLMRDSETMTALAHSYKTLNFKGGLSRRYLKGLFINGQFSEYCDPYLADMLPGGNTSNICPVSEEPGMEWYCSRPNNGEGKCGDRLHKVGPTFDYNISKPENRVDRGWAIKNVLRPYKLGTIWEDLLFEANVTVLNQRHHIEPTKDSVHNLIPGYFHNGVWFDRSLPNFAYPNHDIKWKFFTNKTVLRLGDSILKAIAITLQHDMQAHFLKDKTKMLDQHAIENLQKWGAKADFITEYFHRNFTRKHTYKDEEEENDETVVARSRRRRGIMENSEDAILTKKEKKTKKKSKKKKHPHAPKAHALPAKASNDQPFLAAPNSMRTDGNEKLNGHINPLQFQDHYEKDCLFAIDQTRTRVEFNFTQFIFTHGLPLFMGEQVHCAGKATFSTEVFKRMIKNKWFGRDYMVIMNHGAHFANWHPIVFYNRLVAIKKAAIEYKKYSPESPIIYKTMNWVHGNFDRTYAVTSGLVALQQRDIAFKVFGNPHLDDIENDEEFPVKVVDVLPMTLAAFDHMEVGNVHPLEIISRETGNMIINMLHRIGYF